MPTIRRAIPSDAEEIARLIGELGYPANAGEVAERIAALRDEAVLVADGAEGRLDGVLTTSVMRTIHRPKPVGRVSTLVVSEGLRGSGVGRALMAAAEAHLAEAGCGLVEVTSNNRLAAAHVFYEHLGYAKTSSRFAKTL